MISRPVLIWTLIIPILLLNLMLISDKKQEESGQKLLENLNKTARPENWRDKLKENLEKWKQKRGFTEKVSMLRHSVLKNRGGNVNMKGLVSLLQRRVLFPILLQ